MQLTSSVPVFSALGQNTRLRAFDLLLREGERGMLQGEIARSLGVEKNLLSVHLRILEAAGLVTAERNGRTKTFRVAAGPARDAASGLLAMIGGSADADAGADPPKPGG